MIQHLTEDLRLMFFSLRDLSLFIARAGSGGFSGEGIILFLV